MTRKFNILWHNMGKNAKKLKMKSQEWKTLFLVNLSENFQKFTVWDKMTGRANILWRIFEEITKNLKMKSQEWKTLFLVNLSENFPQIYYFGSCYQF